MVDGTRSRNIFVAPDAERALLEVKGAAYAEAIDVAAAVLRQDVDEVAARDIEVALDLHVGIEEPVEAQSETVESATVEPRAIQVEIGISGADLPRPPADARSAGRFDPEEVLKWYHSIECADFAVVAAIFA